MGYLVLFFLLPIVVKIISRYLKYRKSEYKLESGNGFLKTVFNKGEFGEFLTFYYLEKLQGHNKLMTNLYLPKNDGTTTEVDLIMIAETGIYVFESKNYSGWIFGDEKNKNWTQSLKSKQKNRFFNPIWQNSGHISALKNVVGIEREHLFKSYIVFSERCTLKKINVTSPDVKVIKRNRLLNLMKLDLRDRTRIITTDEVDQLYLKLKKYTCVDEALKEEHIKNIKKKA